MESKPGRLREPPAKRVGPLGLCFEYTALRNIWRVNLGGSGNRLESELVNNMAVFRVHCSPPMDSELGGAQVRLESGTFPLGMGVGTSAIRRKYWRVG